MDVANIILWLVIIMEGMLATMATGMAVWMLCQLARDAKGRNDERVDQC